MWSKENLIFSAVVGSEFDTNHRFLHFCYSVKVISILVIDESTFTKNGVFDSQNSHLCSKIIAHIAIDSNFKYVYQNNVWFGNIMFCINEYNRIWNIYISSLDTLSRKWLEFYTLLRTNGSIYIYGGKKTKSSRENIVRQHLVLKLIMSKRCLCNAKY